MSQTTIPVAPELIPTAPKLRGASKIAADTIKQQATNLYEDLVWKAAEQEQDVDALASDDFAVLHAAGKTVDDFVADVDGIKQRVALQPDIEEHRAVAAEQSKVAEKKRALEAELARVTAEYEAKIGEADAELRELGRRERAVRPAVRHYLKTAPAWIRERLTSLRKEHDRLLCRIKDASRDCDSHYEEIEPAVREEMADVREVMLLLRPVPSDLDEPTTRS